MMMMMNNALIRFNKALFLGRKHGIGRVYPSIPTEKRRPFGRFFVRTVSVPKQPEVPEVRLLGLWMLPFCPFVWRHFGRGRYCFILFSSKKDTTSRCSDGSVRYFILVLSRHVFFSVLFPFLMFPSGKFRAWHFFTSDKSFTGPSTNKTT